MKIGNRCFIPKPHNHLSHPKNAIIIFKKKIHILHYLEYTNSVDHCKKYIYCLTINTNWWVCRMSEKVVGIAMSDEELAKKVERDLKKSKLIFDVLHEM